MSARPSQPGDPSVTGTMEWEVGGRGETWSFERIAAGDPSGYLGVEYGINTDSRWADVNTLGPLISTTSLSAVTGVGQNVNCWASSGSMNATEFLYFGRGTGFAKVNPSTMARVVEASAAMGANITDMIYTRATNGTEQISIALGDATTYRTIDTVSNSGVNDVHTAEAAADKFTRFMSSGLGTDNRIFGAQGTTSTTAARVKGNILTGSITMNSASNWIQVASLAGDNVAITGLGLDMNFVAIGTNGGLYMVDPAFSSFRPIDPETERAATNCAAMGSVTWQGLVYNLLHSLRFIRNGQGKSIGPETMPGNRSPVFGRFTAIQGTDRWLYGCIYNRTDTYLVAGRPRYADDPHSQPITWFTLAKFPSKVSNVLGYLSESGIGSRTLPTLFGGYGDGSTTFDIFYAGLGRNDFWPDDTSYTYSLTGTTYLTESRRQPGLIKDVEAVELVAAGATSANQTITVSIAFDSAAAVALPAITATGFSRQLPVTAGVPTTGWSGYRLKPQLDYATNDSTKAPRVEGKLVVYYRARPRMTKTYETWLVLPQDDVSGKSPRDKVAQLLTEWGSGPVAAEDPNGNSVYVRVDAMDAEEVIDSGNDAGIGAGVSAIAHVKMTLWPTVSGQ